MAVVKARQKVLISSYWFLLVFKFFRKKYLASFHKAMLFFRKENDSEGKTSLV